MFFEALSQLFLFATNAVASTSQSRPILLTDLYGANAKGLQVAPVLALWGVGIATASTTLVYYSFTPAAATIAVPTVGTTGPGTPQPVNVFDAANPRPVFFGMKALTGDPKGTGVPGIFMNDISTGTSVNYYMQLGRLVLN